MLTELVVRRPSHCPPSPTCLSSTMDTANNFPALIHNEAACLGHHIRSWGGEEATKPRDFDSDASHLASRRLSFLICKMGGWITLMNTKSSHTSSNRVNNNVGPYLLSSYSVLFHMPGLGGTQRSRGWGGRGVNEYF